MLKRLMITGLLLSLVIPFLPTVDIAEATSGGQNDETCAEKVAEAVAAMESGLPYEAPDCVYAPGMSAIEMQAAQATTSLYPIPDGVRPIAIEEDVLYARRYRRLVGDNVQIFDTPGGNIIGSIESAFTMVAVGAVNQDWVQIGQGRWVRYEDTSEAPVSNFTGVEITEPLDYPIAWMADWNPRTRLYPSDYPGGPMNENLPRIQHHQLLMIYATEVVDGYEWYMVGPDQWIRQTYVAKVLPVARPEGVGENDLWVAVDLYEQTATAYEGDRMVFATLVSSGRDNAATNEGLFQIYQRHVSTHMTGASGQPDSYFIERVPWVMYFDGDIGLHGSYWHNRFGYRTSAGCVNLSIMDGYWFYNWTADAPDGSAFVYVYSTGVYGGNVPAWARPVIGHNTVD